MTVPVKLKHEDLEQLKGSIVIIKKKVYDVRDFVVHHPGGPVIKTYLTGENATDVFATFHPSSAYEVLANYYIGDLDEMELEKPNAFAEEVRQLRIQLQMEGLFDSSKFYYAWKLLSNFAILASSIYCLCSYGESSWPLLTLSAVGVGIFWQQSGWLAHDFLHHQVFADRMMNNIFGYILGNIFQGFSVDWWKNKHNTHHAQPNIHEFDPDIDTMPFLGWSKHALSKLQHSSIFRQTMRFQPYYYIVLLMFARLAWCQQSLFHAFYEQPPMQVVEVAALAIHWAGYLFLGSRLSMYKFCAFIIISQATCGLLLALVFSLNHNGMPVFTADEGKELDFFRKQIVTGRDLKHTVFLNWFTGGLNYQIEHHLFPNLPRHNFHLVEGRVKDLCTKYDVPYHITGFWNGTKEVLQRLRTVASSVEEQQKLE